MVVSVASGSIASKDQTPARIQRAARTAVRSEPRTPDDFPLQPKHTATGVGDIALSRIRHLLRPLLRSIGPRPLRGGAQDPETALPQSMQLPQPGWLFFQVSGNAWVFIAALYELLCCTALHSAASFGREPNNLRVSLCHSVSIVR